MNKKYLNKSVMLALTAPLMMSGCASIGDMSKTSFGCIGGAILGGGAVLIKTGDSRKAVLGALAGGAVGCAIGNYLDKREAKLKEIAEANDFKPEFERIAVDKVAGTNFSKDASENVIASQISINSDKPIFASSKATVNDSEKLNNLRGFLRGYVNSMTNGSKIYVVGHTDSSGSAEYNQLLSEKRAKYIAQLLVAAGADKNNIFYEGVGESQPVASNQTEVGKAKNRRFELVDVMVVQEKDKNNKQLDSAQLENVVQVAVAKKKRIENVTNTLPNTGIKKSSSTKTKQVAMEPQVKKSRVSRRASLDLGGIPLKSFDEQYVTAAFGEQGIDTGWGLFAKANASSDTPIVGSCAYTGPVVQSKLKAFNGRPIRQAKVSDSLPNLYGNSWWGMAGTTGVSLGPIGIEKDTLNPTGVPRFSFYKNYRDPSKSADYAYPVSVETYKGDGTVLVRMYAKDDNALIKCSDVVFSTTGQQVTKASAVIYQDDNELMAKAFQLQVVKG
jgi:outer membrane protein OmpA-like peptidoglycan-associated protein